MKQETAYGIMQDFGVEAAQAAAISKIFAVTENIPEERERLVEEIKHSGLSPEAARTIVQVFLDRSALQ